MLLLSTMLLSACSRVTDTTETELQSEQEGNLDDFLLISDEYALIRPDGGNENILDMFKIIHGELTALLGSTYPYGTDYVDRGESIPQDNKEILLGLTNRNDSTAVHSQLGAKEYKVCITENHIVIVGKDDLSLYYAVNDFLDNAVVAIDGKLYVPKDLNMTDTYTLRDNSALIPKIKPDSEVQLVKSSSDGDTYTPDWVNDLIIVEANIKNVSGTLENAKTQIVDHLATMGVNGLWLTPIGDSETAHFYGNKGPHTIDSDITGTKDYEEGWKRFKEFVDYAHSKNIRVFIDLVTWGTAEYSPLWEAYLNKTPFEYDDGTTVKNIDVSDWFTGEPGEWGTACYNWESETLREWFTTVVVDMVMDTGVDGIRCDCEPGYSGYEVYGEVKSRLLDKGRKIIIFSEHANKRDGTYDFEQFGVSNWQTVSFSDHQDKKYNWLLNTNIVAAVKNKSGSNVVGANSSEIKNNSAYYRYFTYCVSCHDFKGTAVNKNTLVLAYQALFAPFIPIWYIGEEFGWQGNGSLLYQKMDWSQKESFANVLFMEEIKQLIAIRRTYSDVFSQFAENNREANIVAVLTQNLGSLTAYARYTSERAILIVPNSLKGGVGGTVTVPFSSLKYDKSASYKITDLLTGEVIASGKGAEIEKFKVSIEYQKLGVYALERQ